MVRKIYSLNEQGQALLKTLVDPLSEFYIDAVIDLEEKMEDGDMPEFEGTIFGSEHFDEIKGEWK
jgi:DNA-binding PadR family transcriptional regulator